MEATDKTSRRSVPLFGLYAADVVSLIGTQLTVIAVPWFVLETSGSASQTGITQFFTAGAISIAALLGGSVVDRLGFKVSSVVSDIVSGASIAMVPLLHSTVGLAFWQLIVFVFLANLLNVPGNTSRVALLPDLANIAGMRFERATSITATVERGARLLGAPLAGVLIGIIGTANVLWVDAATFMFSAMIIGILVPVTRAKAKIEGRKSSWRDLLAGIGFIRRDRLILSVVLTVMVMNFIDGSFGGVALPVYARNILGSAVDMGLILSALAGGSVCGALLFGVVGHRLSRRLVFFTGIIVLGLSYWVVSLLPGLVTLLVLEFVVGLAAGPLNPIIATIEFERIPPEMRGRVLGAITAGAYVAVPLGMLLAGFLVEYLGLQNTIMTFAGIYLVVILSLLLNPALRNMGGSSDK